MLDLNLHHWLVSQLILTSDSSLVIIKLTRVLAALNMIEQKGYDEKWSNLQQLLESRPECSLLKVSQWQDLNYQLKLSSRLRHIPTLKGMNLS